MHRLIVTSEAYRMASHAAGRDASEPGGSIPRTGCYWRFPPRRMEAEVVRDSLLRVAGELDLDVGGPDIDHRPGPHLAAAEPLLHPPRRGADAVPRALRRPRPLRRLPPDDLGVPQQALALTNSELAPGRLQPRAGRGSSAGDDGRTEAFVPRRPFEQVLGRPAARA